MQNEFHTRPKVGSRMCLIVEIKWPVQCALTLKHTLTRTAHAHTLSVSLDACAASEVRKTGALPGLEATASAVCACVLVSVLLLLLRL